MNKSIDLKIGGVPEHFNLPWRLAIEEGKFKDVGINLYWSDMSGGTGEMIKGLETETLDIAVPLTEGITKAILEGLNAKILHIYVSTPLHWGIYVPFHSNIMSVKQLEGKTFAISREGSGSHLMSYIKADQEGWNIHNLNFNIVGDIFGGLESLENNKAQAFLWEKYTTFPFTEQKKCRYIDEVITPWSCFVIVVRDEIYKKHQNKLKEMCHIVFNRAYEMKKDKETADMISWRYNLRPEQVKQWLSETDWNYDGVSYPLAFEKTVSYLLKLNLISPLQAENWEEKLFTLK